MCVIHIYRICRFCTYPLLGSFYTQCVVSYTLRYFVFFYYTNQMTFYTQFDLSLLIPINLHYFVVKFVVICAFFGVNFLTQKFCPCKKMTNIRYGSVQCNLVRYGVVGGWKGAAASLELIRFEIWSWWSGRSPEYSIAPDMISSRACAYKHKVHPQPKYAFMQKQNLFKCI